MVTKTLTKHGNSYAVIIERAILDLLGIDNKTLLQISTPDGQSILITPVKSDEAKKRFEESKKKLHKKYGEVFKRLAE